MSQFAAMLTRSLGRLQEKIPEQRVGLVAADAFFTRRVDLPEGLSREERLAFIQLNLEGNSPFPMDQLGWGFLVTPASPHAFVYATPRSRLRKLEIEKPESYYQLFPGFISLYGGTVDRPTVRFLAQGGVLSALYLDPGNPVPSRVLSRRVAGELLTDDVLLAARDEFARTLALDGYGCEDGLWLGTAVRVRQDGRVAFQHRHIDRRGSRGLLENELALDDSALWEADLRDEAYAGKERTIRQRSGLIWTSLRAGIWLAVALLAVQLGTFALAGLNAWRERQIRILEPQATRVENKITLAERLTQSTEEDLKPFLLMEAVNPLRPDSVFFEKVRSKAFNELQIEGLSAEGVSPVNAFADAIRKLAYVGSVEVNSQTRNNQTSFELLITFSALPPEPEGGFVVPSATQEEAADANEPAPQGEE